MNKKNLAFFTFIIIGLFSLFTINIFTQATDSLRTEQKTKICSGEKFVMPQTISVSNEAFENYLKTASLSKDERRKTFSGLSNEQKASFIKVNLALQFIKRPYMTKEQQEFVLDAISKVSADTYDESDAEKARLNEQNGREIENKAVRLFAYKELGDFIEPLMTSKVKETALLQKYENLLKNGMKARKKLVKEMPLDDRVNIWKTQLIYHLTTASLSQPQRELILEFLTTLSPATFVHPVNETKEESVKADEILDKKIQSVFSKAESFAIFEDLGIQKIVSDTNQTNSFMGEVPVDLPVDSPWSFCNCRWYCGTTPGSCGGATCNVEVQECGAFGGSWSTSKCG
jgi:hypothetical protein